MATKEKKTCKNHPNRIALCKELCSACYWSVNKVKYALKNKGGVKKPVLIRNASEKREILNNIYGILCRELKPQHLSCQGNLEGCTHRATQIHHKKGRRNYLLIMSKHFCYLCKNCHDFCTVHSFVAMKIGLSMPINSTTEYDFTDREIELMIKYKVKIPC